MDQNKAAKRQVSIITAYKRVFSGPEGDRVLADLMQSCHMLGSSYNGNLNDVVFHEGERNVVLRILKNMNVDVQKLQERIRQNEIEDLE